MIDRLKNIVQNNYFKELAIINNNFFNLKQELHIRNSLVIKFNKLCGEDELAVAEYPKSKFGSAIDLSLLKNGTITNKLEIKYQYPNDLNVKQVRLKLLKDTNEFKGELLCSDFLLVVHERNFDSTPFSKFKIKINLPHLKEKFSDCHDGLLTFENGIKRSYNKCIIQLSQSLPYPNTYHFIFYHFT